MSGFLYFVQEDHSGPIKIGYTENLPAARLNQMQVGNPRRLQLIAVIKGVPREEEGRWHQEFAEVRFVGEWFHPTAGLLTAILEKGSAPSCMGPEAPGGVKARQMGDVGRGGWISPGVRTQLLKKREAAA